MERIEYERLQQTYAANVRFIVARNANILDMSKEETYRHMERAIRPARAVQDITFADSEV